MMANDPALSLEFAERLSSDRDFAASPADRLQFFYRRSVYWDKYINLYPVGRITTPLDL